MKIVVCIKQVPDTTEVKLDPVTGTLIRNGIPSIINPDDKAGLEAALKLKDEVGAHITVLTMGPGQADIALREALAMGADEAILLSDRVFAGSDTWATSSAVSGAIKNLEFDLIIAGRQAIDGDTAQVGCQIAEILDLPQITYVEDLKCENGKIIVKRQFEDRYHIIEVQTPALLTVLSEMNDPRYMTVSGIFDAYNEKEVKNWTYEDIKENVEEGNLGLKGSPTKVKKSFPKTGKSKGVVFADVSPEEGADIIIEKLKEKYYL